MARNEIFISYSHKDKRWLDEILITLKPLTRKRKIDVWDDTKITVGSKWKQEIASALARAKVAVLLVSRNFLHSQYIAEHEFEPLLKRAEEDGLIVVWIAIGHSLYEETEIAEYQAANEPTRPLNSLSESDADLELVKIAKAIDRLLEPETSVLEQVSADDSTSIEEHAVSVTEQNQKIHDALRGASEKLRRALAEGKWAWRSIDVLATKAGITPDQTLELLRSDPEIELGRAKSGKMIARLRESSLH
jgi:hypothetical protein